jgi:hypothetical protein
VAQNGHPSREAQQQVVGRMSEMSRHAAVTCDLAAANARASMRRSARLVVALAVLLGAACAPTGTGDAHAATTRTFSIANCATRVSSTHGIGCGEALASRIKRLTPGDVLLIAPGTYDVDSTSLRPLGTAASRVTIAAQDPSRRPLLRGWVVLSRATHATISGVDFQAAVPGRPALQTLCGVGWTLEKSHVFGANQTKAVANLMIAGRQKGAPSPDDGQECTEGPRAFTVRDSFFSNPYTEAGLNGSTDQAARIRGTTFHNIYIAFEGTTATDGRIEHNVIVGNRNGAGIKLGDGQYQTLGPWGVRIAYNTIAFGQRGIYLLNDVRHNTMVGNLIFDMREGGGIAGKQVGVALNDVWTATNSIAHTYGAALTTVWGQVKTTGATLRDLGGNRIGPDPAWTNFVLVPGNPEASMYGAYARESFG